MAGMIRLGFGKLLLLFVFLLSIVPLAAQQHRDITFDAELSKTKMLQNSTVEYTVMLRNSQGSEFKPPKFSGFAILSGPTRTMGSKTINGATTTYQAYTWLIQPQRTGKLNIQPASIKAAGRTYRSNSATVEVLPIDSKLAASAPDNFMRLEVSKDTAYVGEQLIMNVVLYTSDNAISRNLAAEPDLSEFFSYGRRQFDGRSRNVLENGKEYLARTISSTALYPLKSGELVIEPYRLLLGLVRYRNPQSTFSRRYTERIPLQTDTFHLQVNELPSPRPENFSGGVGKFKMEVSIDRTALSTDDAITLRLNVNGQGDVKRITAPEPVDKNNWVIYDPEVLKEEFYDSPTGIYGQKILEYKIVPKRAGKQTLTPTLSYFNPDSNRYVNLQSVVYDIDVSQGSAVVNYDEPEEKDSTAVLELIPASEVRTLKRYNTTALPYSLAIPLFLLPLLLFGGYYFYDQKKQAEAAIDPAEKARLRARKAADGHLQHAKTALNSAQTADFYNAIEDALLGYLRDKFQLPVKALSKRNIEQVLLQRGAPQSLATKYVDLLKRCELALYAGGAGATNLQAAYSEAEQLIIATEAAVEASK